MRATGPTWWASGTWATVIPGEGYTSLGTQYSWWADGTLATETPAALGWQQDPHGGHVAPGPL
jgi:hypothetical protein